MSELPDTDFTQRFIFDDRDIRGEWVGLDRSYAEVLARHPYPQPVASLLGELMAATALLVGALKFDGLLILQARSEGPIPLLMIECSSEREIRGLARYEADRIAPDATLQMAAKMMDDLNVGALPVCDNRRLVGMITDRDITVRATASDLRPSEVRVSDIMTEHPRWCLESQTLEEVAQQMSDVQVRRIPVLDEDNELIGIVSLGDIAVREPEAVQDVLREISTPSEPDRPAAST